MTKQQLKNLIFKEIKNVLQENDYEKLTNKVMVAGKKSNKSLRNWALKTGYEV